MRALRRRRGRILVRVNAALAVAVPELAPSPTDASDARWERWIPEWVRRIGMAVWVTGPGGRIVYVNERAERLLGVAARDATGRACHVVVGARTATGAAFCGARCPFVVAADADGEIEPADVRIGGRAGRDEHWLQVTAIPVDGPDRTGRWIVHAARVADRERRLERHVARVAARSEEIRESDGPRARRPLSPREREVLDLLARDVELGRVAAQLGITYVTVRNHVQHVLTKLGAHSVEEAVAIHVLR
jgi:DNA-binding CsgD family transcriptional regulator